MTTILYEVNMCKMLYHIFLEVYAVQPKYEIDEYAFPLIEEIYDEIQFIMATQGYKMDNPKQTLNDANILHTTRNGIKAFGIYDGEKFEVLEGSQIDFSKSVYQEKYNIQRQELLNKGEISFIGGKHILNVTLEFQSPSGASDFILGGSTNGWVEWKTTDDKTLDEIFRK